MIPLSKLSGKVKLLSPQQTTDPRQRPLLARKALEEREREAKYKSINISFFRV